MVTLRGKCNGAKRITEDMDFSLTKVVAERSSCAEAEPKGQVERGEVRMLE